MNSVNKFQVGTTYYTRSIGDHNCIYTAKIVSRTDKTVCALIDNDPTVKRFRPYIYEGKEQIRPHGTYSMCAIIDANDTTVLRPDWCKVSVSA